jgi:hypothetical protein
MYQISEKGMESSGNYTQNLRDKLPREVISKLNLDPSDTSYAMRAEKIASIKKGLLKDFTIRTNLP